MYVVWPNNNWLAGLSLLKTCGDRSRFVVRYPIDNRGIQKEVVVNQTLWIESSTDIEEEWGWWLGLRAWSGKLAQIASWSTILVVAHFEFFKIHGAQLKLNHRTGRWIPGMVLFIEGVFSQIRSVNIVILVKTRKFGGNRIFYDCLLLGHMCILEVSGQNI